MPLVEVVKENNGIVTITLNRPEVRNALNDKLIQEITQVFADCNRQSDISAIVLKGKGKSFCAGGDLSYIKTAHQFKDTTDVDVLVGLLQTIDQCPHPVIAQVHGHAIGGGLGLMSVCDIVATTQDTKFAFSEVKLGLIPAIISVFILNKVPASHCLDMMLTGEMFDANTAFTKGFSHFVGTPEQVNKYVADKCYRLSSVGQQAVKHCKALVKKINGTVSDELLSHALALLKQVRSSKEGQEGIAAFLEKRKPSWNS